MSKCCPEIEHIIWMIELFGEADFLVKHEKRQPICVFKEKTIYKAKPQSGAYCDCYLDLVFKLDEIHDVARKADIDKFMTEQLVKESKKAV